MAVSESLESYLQLICSLFTFLLFIDTVCAYKCMEGYPAEEEKPMMHSNESFPNNVSNITFQFNSSVLCLGEVISYSNINNIEMKGTENSTLIQCEQSAGLMFHRVNNLSLIRLSFNKCAFNISTEISRVGLSMFVGIYILDSQHITIIDLAVKNSPGTGMIIADSYGVISISNCRFQNNKANATRSGGGIYIDLSRDSWADYSLSGCEFLDNHVSESNFSYDVNCNDFRRGVGGGVGIALRRDSKNVSITIQDTQFYGNSAIWGGGLTVTVCDSVSNNNLIIINSSFESNEAMCSKSGCGGGGFTIVFGNSSIPKNNKLCFGNVTIKNNTAEYGGGMSIYSDYIYTSEEVSNSIEFDNCSWIQNKGKYGSAADISPIRQTALENGSLPSVLFRNCNFLMNSASCSGMNQAPENSTVCQIGYGALTITYFQVVLAGAIKFSDNKNSAIYAIISEIFIKNDCIVNFTGNSGRRGGGVALIDSFIIISNFVRVLFENNSASSHGDAIYSETIDLHDFIEYKSCFIQAQNPHGNTFEFIGNNITEKDFIYATSLQSCLKACPPYTENSSIADKLQCIGNFSFPEVGLLSSETGQFLLKENETLPFEVIPGIRINIPFDMQNDCKQNIRPALLASISGSKIRINNSLFYSNSKMKLYGTPGDKAEIQITAEGLRGLTISFNVTMLQCPPFFNFEPKEKECVCNEDVIYYYAGIKKCSNRRSVSSIQHGFWIGYEGPPVEYNLLVGYCPNNYCFKQNDLTTSLYHKLPLRASMLDEKVCGRANRKNITCCKCKEGYSVYFHSENFDCGPENLCNLGSLYYLVSEILPLSAFFVIILLFNIKFTSGELNGFIFFAQVSDMISDFGQKNIYFKHPSAKTLYKLVYKAFNFDFFSVDDLSFCLFKSARTIDIIVFKYVSVVYGLILLLLSVVILKYCNRYTLCKGKKRCNNLSALHGLTTFLILVYSQCLKVSFQILYPGYIYNRTQIHRTVVFHQGDIAYFNEKHLPYVFPAVFSLIVINLALPTLLVSYPLSNRIVAFFKLDRFATIRCIARNIPIIKLKPLIDSFQGSFKDKYRFFSGLYFFYRILILLPRGLADFYDTYVIFQIEFLLIMFIHMLAWPYENYRHNILDAMLFLNLSLINSLNIIADTYSRQGHSYYLKADIANWLQLLLLYLPIIYITIRFAAVICSKLRSCVQRKKSEPTQNGNITNLLELSLDGNDERLATSSLNFSDSYRLLKERKLKMYEQ